MTPVPTTIRVTPAAVESIHGVLQEFVSKNDELVRQLNPAQRVMAPRADSTLPTVWYLGRVSQASTWSFFSPTTYNFNIGNTTVVGAPQADSKASKEKKEELSTTHRAAIGLASVITIGVASYFFGQYLGHLKASSEELEEVGELRNVIKGSLSEADAERINRAATDVREEIFKNIRNTSLRRLAYATGFVVAAALGIAAAYTAVPVLAAYALVIGGVSGVSSIVEWGFASSDTTNQRLSTKLQTANYKLRNMQLQWEVPVAPAASTPLAAAPAVIPLPAGGGVRRLPTDYYQNLFGDNYGACPNLDALLRAEPQKVEVRTVPLS